MPHVPFSDRPLLPTAALEALVAASSAADAERCTRIVLGMSGAYWERDFDRGVTWYSPTFFQVLGLPASKQEHERERINARIHPDDRDLFEAAYEAALRSGGAFRYDVRFLDGHGEYRWARAEGRVWLHPDGRPHRLIGMMSDVHLEKEARTQADESQARYQRALNASSEAHFERTVGQSDFSTSVNLAEMMGHPPGTPPPDEQEFTSWIHPDDLQVLTLNVRKAMSGEGPWEATYRIRQHDGSYRWFRGRGRTVRSEEGELRMTGMLGDVHQQVLDRQELDQHRQNLTALVAERTASLDAALKEAQRQRSQAEQANRAKSEFLAHMSHELRTPLNGMLGMTELALRVSEDPAQRRYLEVALNSGRSLLRLINDVLDFSRSDSQLPPMEEAPYDLADLLANVVRSLMPALRPKGLGLRFDWEGEELTRVCGDALRVRQVVTNLVGNACKYTPQGHVAVRAGIERAGADSTAPAWAVVQIEDTGPGIDASRREAVFEPFVQGDPSLTRGHGGAGLGLAISRRLARAMGGDVTLLRSGEEGSVFQFRWPVQLDTAASPPVGHRAGHAWLLSERAAAGDWIAQRLGRMGWTAEVKAGVVTTLNDAGTASVLPQLVLVSEQVMSEPADLAALRAALPAAHIALTVRADWNQPALEEAARLHRMPLAVVPLTPRDLHALLTAAAPLAPEGASATPQRRAQILVVDDNAVNRMVIEAMLGELDAQPLSAEDGAQALACCRHQAPDLVLMDLQMPVMDGLATTRRLRELQREGRLPRFPILALTAHAGDDDRRQALDAGMDDYLTKPLQLPMLEAALRRWIALR